MRSEQAAVTADLTSAGVLDGLRWAAWSAYLGVVQDYRPSTGHSQAWVGITAYDLLQNRFDRVFQCGDFFASSTEAAAASLDILQEGISKLEFETMPRTDPGVVIRDDLNGSAGWRVKEWRWLTASFSHCNVDQINWNQMRLTKRTVAAQPFVEGPDLFTPDEGVVAAPLAELLAPSCTSDPIRTLIFAHRLDKESSAHECFIGRPKISRHERTAWHWRIRIEGWPPRTPSRDLPYKPNPLAPDHLQVPPAPVKLRKSNRSDHGPEGTSS